MVPFSVLIFAFYMLIDFVFAKIAKKGAASSKWQSNFSEGIAI
jgi:hypothetical protein